MSAYQISKDQQKVFIDRFITEVEKLANQVLDRGADYGSPGKLVQKVSDALVKEIRNLAAPSDGAHDEVKPGRGDLH